MKIMNAGDFGQTIKNRRRELGYTQDYVSYITGLSKSFISNLENGKATCELGKSIELANLLGIDCIMNSRGV